MSYWSNLKKAIADVIKANNNQEITGPMLQHVLLNIITSIGENATFAGVAFRNTNPGMSDGPRFWIAAEPGIYPNFGSVEVPENAIGIISTSNSKSASYYANDIKRPGKALTDDGTILSGQDSYTSLVFYAIAGDHVQLPSASSVGADTLSIKILKSDGSVDKSVGDVYGDTFIAPATGNVWAEYYKVKTGSSIVFGDGAKVTVGKVVPRHKVLWIGTSIPSGDGTLTGTYPLQVRSNLGIKTLYNNSIAASGIVKFSGYLGNGRDGLDLSETVAEKEARYRSKVQDGTISEATLNYYKFASFEKCLLPYINGSVDSCDTVIIDHGYNDREVLATEIGSNVELSNKNRSSFIGAFNYIIDKIYAINPKIRIIVIGFYMRDNYDGNGWEMHGKDINAVLSKISAFYNFMYIPTYNGSCINPANFNNMCPDGVHPHSDTSGTAVKNIAEYLTNSLRDVL